MCRRRVPRVLTVGYWLLCLIILYCAGTALLGVIVVNGRLLRNAFTRLPPPNSGGSVIGICIWFYFFHPPPVDVVFHFSVRSSGCGGRWGWTSLARETNIALKRQHPRVFVCLCVCVWYLFDHYCVRYCYISPFVVVNVCVWECALQEMRKWRSQGWSSWNRLRWVMGGGWVVRKRSIVWRRVFRRAHPRYDGGTLRAICPV